MGKAKLTPRNVVIGVVSVAFVFSFVGAGVVRDVQKLAAPIVCLVLFVLFAAAFVITGVVAAVVFGPILYRTR